MLSSSQSFDNTNKNDFKDVQIYFFNYSQTYHDKSTAHIWFLWNQLKVQRELFSGFAAHLLLSLLPCISVQRAFKEARNTKKEEEKVEKKQLKSDKSNQY